MSTSISLADFDVAAQPGLRERLATIYQEFRSVQAGSQKILEKNDVTTLRADCPGCATPISNSRVLFSKNEVPHAQCDRCHLVYTQVTLTIDSDAAQYNDSAFMRAYVKLKRHPMYAQLETTKASYLLQRAQAHRPQMCSTLDIGASTGAAMAAAASAGFISYGIEPDSAMAELLSEQYPLCFVNGYFPQDMPSDWPAFDLITLFDVLEHMLDPLAFLKAMRPALSESGMLLIQVPNFNSLLVQLQGPANTNFCIGHWQHFTAETLTSLMQRAGFRCIETGNCISELDQILTYSAEQIAETTKRLLGQATPITNAEDLYAHGLGYKLYGLFAPIFD